MKTISFFATGEPKGQPRARAFAMKRSGQTMVRMYDPATAEAWKSQIALAAKQYHGQQLEGPVSLTIDFFFPRPKSHFRSSGDLKPTAPTYHTSKPDCDNAAKAVLDALTVLQFWQDDKQVAVLTVTKRYTAAVSHDSPQHSGNCRPGAIITLKELEAAA